MTAKTEVTAVFDIGKTNKKFFLFDKEFNEVYREYTTLDETTDEDGYPAENLPQLQQWLKGVFDRILHSGEYRVRAINFSSYGASFVHLDETGNVLTPLYNYTKPFPESVADEFYNTYGDALSVAAETASPREGMLNSGMQLYWLKKTRPEVFSKIKYSIHFPQYLSYLFTGVPLSDYTSIGCHTGLWDYEANDYHSWVYREEIDKKLPPIVPSETSLGMTYKRRKIKVGVGIHDSSAALLPYILSEKKPFLLVSTGTWSISLNPFNQEPLTREDIEYNCLNYMRTKGKRVKATRFFMGNEYRIQVKKLGEYYGKAYGYHRKVKFDKEIYKKLISRASVHFKFEGIRLRRRKLNKTDLAPFASFEEAFHQLMIELMELQVETSRRAIGNTELRKIFIDGGFTDNEVFVKLMAHHFKDFKVRTTRNSLGSALGAAMVISEEKPGPKFLKKTYKMEKLSPLLLSPETDRV
ncbi:FGGY-family carbohydrate kinase [Sinomicrobium soli]|uniref:FGGY-family carbohydrate kinase n=1 Tax=Sinomicrobium sp. N-1-3-6 TaxID=2219864 RepID=UPI000DCCE704|nr:FGGY family carbohydrate kinase [Sinomicrobium sp. N-1-3-6]RAV28129.1 carbohydrate kinase [Sinomicrobium sp. N-1-3-6]